MNIDKIISYIFYTPYNINRTILEQMLKEMISYYGGNPDFPDENIPGIDKIVYDGGIEA